MKFHFLHKPFGYFRTLGIRIGRGGDPGTLKTCYGIEICYIFGLIHMGFYHN